ncbi:hypothetical protein STN0717ENT73_23550 [Enterobacter cloacae]|nr:hypothetical protein STN0717ENT73_23550 [Enterobacter cloacae]
MSSKEDLINAFNKSASDKEIGEKKQMTTSKSFKSKCEAL